MKTKTLTQKLTGLALSLGLATTTACATIPYPKEKTLPDCFVNSSDNLDRSDNLEIQETVNYKALMQEYFTQDFIDQHYNRLENIAKNSGEHAWMAFLYLPQEAMPEHSKELVKISEELGEKTGIFYHHLSKNNFEDYNLASIRFAERHPRYTNKMINFLQGELNEENKK